MTTIILNPEEAQRLDYEYNWKNLVSFEDYLAIKAQHQMVSWLINNFRKIKSEEVTYKDYEKFGNSLGIMTYNEESFNNFKNQEYV